MSDYKFKIGDKVHKIKGYKWPGVIVSRFQTLDGFVRYVVECTVPEVAGALHIYNGSEIELDSHSSSSSSPKD
jgi:hypothetical protein